VAWVEMGKEVGEMLKGANKGKSKGSAIHLYKYVESMG